MRDQKLHKHNGKNQPQVTKTTPENVKEAHEALFHATMNLPTAAAHCGMTQKEMKMAFWEYLKYNEPNFQVTENTTEVSWGQESSDD